MQIEINNEVIDLKLLPSKAGSISFSLEDKKFTFTLSDIEKDLKSYEQKSNGSVLINAFNENYEINSVSTRRIKELKKHAGPTKASPQKNDNKVKVAVAIMKAYQARSAS